MARRRDRRPQLQVYLPDALLNEMADAVAIAGEQEVRPSTLSELVEDAVRAHLSIVSRRVNGGRVFDQFRGATLRSARRRGKTVT